MRTSRSRSNWFRTDRGVDLRIVSEPAAGGSQSDTPEPRPASERTPIKRGDRSYGHRVECSVIAAIVVTIGTANAKPRWAVLPMPRAMPPAERSGKVAIDGAQIYYAIYGKGEPVILLHGGLGNADHFANQVTALADKFEVIVIDSRGQGRSTLSQAPISYRSMAKDVIGVMDALRIHKASFVGWSDGGEIALALGVEYPDRVHKLFVLGANYDARGSKSRSSHSATFGAYASKCRSDYLRMSDTPRAYDRVVEALLPVWRNPAVFTKDELRAIKAPTMVADGDHDEIIALDQVEEMAKLIPNAQLKIFSETSHFVLWQDPASVNQALVEFLNK
jgi:pimeloyl-ACP methyl ester carboxylesterase